VVRTLLTLALACPVAASAQTPVRVTFTAADGVSAMHTALALVGLGIGLADSGLRVVSPRDTSARSNANLAGARYMITARAEQAGETLLIRSQLVEVETSRVIAQDFVRALPSAVGDSATAAGHRLGHAALVSRRPGSGGPRRTPRESGTSPTARTRERTARTSLRLPVAFRA
jgi:hypothetical protein